MASSSPPKAKVGNVSTFLSLLTSKSSLTMSQAMVAAKFLFPKYTTLASLAHLNATELAALGIEDAGIRKGILALNKKSGAGRAAAKSNKRAPNDLDKPLPRKKKDTTDRNEYLIDEISHPEALARKFVVINRAPVLSAWAFVVAETMGFNRREALSLGHAFQMRHANQIYTGGQSLIKGGLEQPSVHIMNQDIPVIELQSGEYRALVDSASPLEPARAFKYLDNAFQQHLGAVVGLLRLLAESLDKKVLDGNGALGMYQTFCHKTSGTGASGRFDFKRVLDLLPPLSKVKETPTRVKVEAKVEGQEPGEEFEVVEPQVKAEEDIKPGVKQEIHQAGEEEDDGGSSEREHHAIKHEQDKDSSDHKPLLVNDGDANSS